ncbi:hypothetical protein V493_04324 [Pseudogymnoascus sp. VKM F-4281 (FW-2241)]|nr:hypothetical protein V493_04324 [Pseudogymnoascus sp. VKM F-4281 (FW-2241)]
MAAKSLIPLLVAMMLLTGCCNTLFTKYQDNQCVANCDDPNPDSRKHFEQPVIQTAQMFIGEMGCWLVVGIFSLYQRFAGDRSVDQGPEYHAIHEDDDDAGEADEESLRNPALRVLVKDEEGRLPLTGWKVTMLALPATCDILGTTLMNAGFLFVVASVYQMTRGMLVIWVGIFSVVFLKKHLYLFQWSALATVVLGVSLVGLAGSLQAEDVTKPASVLEGAKNAAVIMARVASTPDAISTMIGVFLIAGAQIFTATQFVLEEFILEKYALEPLRVVGWEGIFGFTFTTLGMLVLHLAIGRTPEGQLGYFDAVEGLRQGVQLLRPLSDEERERDFQIYDRYMSDTIHLDRIPQPWMGTTRPNNDTSSSRFRSSRLRHVSFQWYRATPTEALHGIARRGTAARGANRTSLRREHEADGSRGRGGFWRGDSTGLSALTYVMSMVCLISLYEHLALKRGTRDLILLYRSSQ